MAAFLDVCRFNPTLGGTTDWTVSSAVTGYQTPASAGAVNATVYRYRAESADLTQWEIGYGTYTVAGTVLARTTVLFNSSGTTAKINFSAAPQVAVVALAEDLPNLATPNAFTDTTASTSTTTGALKVSGGVGVAGAMNAASATLTSPLPVASGGTNYAGGAWTAYTPTVTGSGGTYTFTGTAAQLTIGKIQYVSVDITVTVASGAPTQCNISYPSVPKRSTYLLGRESGVGGKMCVWRSSDGAVIAYDNSTPAATGSIFNFTGAYEIA